MKHPQTFCQLALETAANKKNDLYFGLSTPQFSWKKKAGILFLQHLEICPPGFFQSRELVLPPN